jgi:hypothetical protein
VPKKMLPITDDFNLEVFNVATLLNCCDEMDQTCESPPPHVSILVKVQGNLLQQLLPARCAWGKIQSNSHAHDRTRALIFLYTFFINRFAIKCKLNPFSA